MNVLEPTRRLITARRHRWLGGLLAMFATAPLAPTQEPQPGPQPGLQRPPLRTLSQPIEFATSQDDNLFSLVRSQEQIHTWEVALAELRAGEVASAVQRLHGVVQTDTGGVVPVAPGRFLGLRLAVVQTMANLPPAATEAYEDLVRREAGNLADAALPGLPAAQLERLAERFPAARIGLAARIRLGDLALEAGDGPTAIAHFRSALDATRFGSRDEARVAERLHLAAVLDDPAAARADKANEVLDAAGDEVLSTLPALATRQDWPAYGGGHGGRTPMTRPAGDPSARHWTEDVAAPGFQSNDHGELAMFPVGDLDGLFINTGQELICFDPLRHTFAWVSPAPMQEESGRRLAREAHINPDHALAAAYGDDVVVAALQVPDNTQNVNFNGGLPVISKLALRRTFAFSRSSGKLLWSHWDGLDGLRTRRFRGHDVCGPPLVAGDTVYVPVHDRAGAIAFAIAAYDLHTGQPKWRRLVCSSQQDVNMFGNANMEFAASPLNLSEGVLYGASNLGVAYALEASTGRVRWVTSYEVITMPRNFIHRQQDRAVFFANNPPAVTAGVVCCTPLDSPFALGIDAESGQMLWRLSFDATVDRTQNRVAWLAGCFDDEFLLTGAGAVAVKARPANGTSLVPQVRQLVRPDQLGSQREGAMPGRPAVTGQHIWFPRYGRLVPFDRAGNVDESITVASYVPGNLLFVDGIVVSLKQRSLDVLMDASALQAQVEARRQAAPDDPAAILRLATLRRALLPSSPTAQEQAALQDLYQEGLQGCVRRNYPPTHPVRMALQRELFEHARDRATEALQSGVADGERLLAMARDNAPQPGQWIEMQALVLQRCRGDATRFLTELDRLEREAPTGVFPFGDGVPVRTYVLWQRALVAEHDPAAAVLLWQELLESHADVQLGEQTAATAAELAIDRLKAQGGDTVYAAVAARADRALADAHDDDLALDRVAHRFPNSAAARTARARLLDAAVRRGDLRVAGEVLAQGLRSGAPAPGMVRRVLVAAQRRGNLALAAAMAALLASHAQEPSDWPDDAGAPYGKVLEGLAETLRLGTPSTDVTLPAEVTARIPPRNPGEYLRLLDLVVPSGFQARADQPLYVIAGRELLAIDTTKAATDRGVLFALPADFLEHVYLCGDALVVPDMDRLQAVDYRSGKVLWTLPNDNLRQLECLGLEGGVLQMQAHPAALNGLGEVFGVEPTSGAVLWRRGMTSEQLRAKQVPGQVLLLAIGPTGAHIDGLDPVTGLVARAIDLGGELQNELHLDRSNLSTGLYPLALAADAERVYLPVDGIATNEAPRLFAVDNHGQVAWRWQGTAGLQLEMVGLRGSRLVVVERSERSPGRIVLLRAGDGSEARTVEVGPDAVRLNWERALVPNPAPAVLAVTAIADLQSRVRELFCFPVDGDGPVFVQALGSEDGEVQPSPVFGRDPEGNAFVAFCVQPVRSGTAPRLYALDLATRKGLLPRGARYLSLESTSRQQVGSSGPYTVVASRQGLLLLRGKEAPR